MGVIKIILRKIMLSFTTSSSWYFATSSSSRTGILLPVLELLVKLVPGVSCHYPLTGHHTGGLLVDNTIHRVPR